MSKEEIIEKVKSGDLDLRNLSKEEKDDFDIVLEAVQNFGLSLMFASDRLKDNDDIVTEAMKQSVLILKFASERLQNDYELLKLLKSEYKPEWELNNDKWYKEKMEILTNIESKMAIEQDVVLSENKAKKVKFLK